MLGMAAGDREVHLLLHCALSFHSLTNLGKISFHFAQRHQTGNAIFFYKSEVLPPFPETVDCFDSKYHKITIVYPTFLNIISAGTCICSWLVVFIVSIAQIKWLQSHLSLWRKENRLFQQKCLSIIIWFGCLSSTPVISLDAVDR